MDQDKKRQNLISVIKCISLKHRFAYQFNQTEFIFNDIEQVRSDYHDGCRCYYYFQQSHCSGGLPDEQKLYRFHALHEPRQAQLLLQRQMFFKEAIAEG